MTATSQADPTKLRQYADGCHGQTVGVRAEATALAGALRNLASAASTSPYPPHPGNLAERLLSLVERWAHLDEFMGDVATGFERADRSGGGRRIDIRARTGGIVTVSDDVLAALGGIGFADRAQAVLAASSVADAIKRWRDNPPVSEADIELLASMLERSQYDPAFAVVLVEQLGVAGLVDAVAMVRHAYQIDDEVPLKALDVLEGLGQTLTTALDTLPDVPDDQRRNPLSASLPDDQRLSWDVVDDLLGDYQPIALELGDIEPLAVDRYPGATELDLSVLMRFTDPPTGLARRIATEYLTPRLERPDASFFDMVTGWGALGGVVANYATMLGRNQNASARWLTAGDNLDKVLAREGRMDVDNGQALATVVENALTHPDADRRTHLLNRAIDIVLSQGEIRSTPMHTALASGVTANLAHLDVRINGTWNARNDTDSPSPEAITTRDFLAILMADDDAATQTWVGLLDYSLAEIGATSIDDNRIVRLEQIGELHGLFVDAEGKALHDDARRQFDRQVARSQLIDTPATALSYVPEPTVQILSGVADVTEAVTGKSIGQHLFPADIDTLEAANGSGAIVRINSRVRLDALVVLARHPDTPDIAVEDLVRIELADLKALDEQLFAEDVEGHDDANDLLAGASTTADGLESRR